MYTHFAQFLPNLQIISASLIHSYWRHTIFGFYLIWLFSKVRKHVASYIFNNYVCFDVCWRMLAIMEILFMQNVGTCVDPSHMSSQAAKYIVPKNFCITCIKSFFHVRIRIRSFTRSSIEITIFPCKMSTIFIECVGLFCHVHLSSQLFHLNSPHFRWNYLAAVKCSFVRSIETRYFDFHKTQIWTPIWKKPTNFAFSNSITHGFNFSVKYSAITVMHFSNRLHDELKLLWIIQIALRRALLYPFQLKM